MTGNQTRQQFLDYFSAQAHRVVPSSSLVPLNDPTLLFTNAGMNQFKDVFLGREQRDYRRATTSQKCVRAGGKHNDLENVGYTRRHHTFFEMLGNFSFGDYFKRDAIAYAWELITKVYGLEKDRLYVTVFREDDEAEELWQSVVGVPKNRIFRLDEKDNFWQMGETGPCGPCSEIHYDLGIENAEPGREHEQFPDDGGGRFVEIWNLVFMQYDRDTAGTLTPLPRPSIDTGMGLERVAAILQGKASNYESDLIRPIIDYAAQRLQKSYGGDTKFDTALRILADHARSTTFLIHDGVVPSNEGRGYVLRKIMRRAMRNLRMVGVAEPLLADVTGFVAEHMRAAYPELLTSTARAAKIVREEEHRYATTFQVAEKVFHDEARGAAGGVLPGAAAFKLYDTFGLALDEQEEMAREYGLAIDRPAFEIEMQQQRERARASWKTTEKEKLHPAFAQYAAQGRTRFLGYDTLCGTGSRVLGLLIDGAPVESADADTAVEIVLDQTPFYAEAGGQVGDQGVLTANGSNQPLAHIDSVYSPLSGLSVHRAHTLGTLRVGDLVSTQVERSLRRATMRNHTATHLLQAALRQVLGVHVKQAGSVVEPTRLRFDFTHYTGVDPDELRAIERLVNEQILANQEVTTNLLSLDEALQTGAMALFGEKYGETVRVVSIPDFSKELCGGTHVARTGDIGLCKIVYEGSISAGIRRIEAVTGEGALERFQETSTVLARAAQTARVTEGELVEQVDRFLQHQKASDKEVEFLKTKLANAEVSQIESGVRELKGVKVLVRRLDGFDRAQLRVVADSLRNKHESAVIVLASATADQVMLLSAVSKNLTGKVHAGKLVGILALAIGGKGGGRPDLAEAGGKDVQALPAALASIYQEVENLL